MHHYIFGIILYSGVRMGVEVIEEMGDGSCSVLVGVAFWVQRIPGVISIV